MEEQKIVTVQKSNNSWKDYLSTKIEQKGTLIVDIEGKRIIPATQVASIIQEWINSQDQNQQGKVNEKADKKQANIHEKNEGQQQRKQSEKQKVKNIQVINFPNINQDSQRQKQVLLKIIISQFGQQILLDEIQSYMKVRIIMKQYLKQSIGMQQSQQKPKIKQNKYKEDFNLADKTKFCVNQEVSDLKQTEYKILIDKQNQFTDNALIQKKFHISQQQVFKNEPNIQRRIQKDDSKYQQLNQLVQNKLEQTTKFEEQSVSQVNNKNVPSLAKFSYNNSQKQNQQKLANSLLSQYRQEVLIQQKQHSFNIRKSRNTNRSSKQYMSVNNSCVSVGSEMALQKNQYLNKMFKHLCQQNVSKGRSPTFDQIAQASNSMNLNKWMVFCKQFTFSEKLGKRILINTFKNATDQKSQMSYTQFINAVYVLQELVKVETQVLVKEILQVNNQLAFRNKIHNLKVQYFGPSKNFFEECRYKQQDKKITEAFKSKERKRRDEQMQKIRLKLIEKRQNQRGSKMLAIPRAMDHRERSNHRKFVQQISSYSGIFKYKRETAHSTQASCSFKLNKVVQQAKKQTKQRIVNNSMYEQPTSVSLHGQQLPMNYMSEGFNLYKGQNLPSIKMQSIEERLETYIIDSDAQSDQILKEHYRNQKKGKQDNAYSRVVEQIILKTEERDNLYENHQLDQDDDATTYMITQYR